jgi:hypothetical protein
MTTAAGASVGAKTLKKRTGHVDPWTGAVGTKGAVAIDARGWIGKRGTAFDAGGPDGKNDAAEESKGGRRRAHKDTSTAPDDVLLRISVSMDWDSFSDYLSFTAQATAEVGVN